MFESWIMDARYAARRLLSRPSYAALAVLTLALAAGGTAAIFSVVRTLLLESAADRARRAGRRPLVLRLVAGAGIPGAAAKLSRL